MFNQTLLWDYSYIFKDYPKLNAIAFIGNNLMSPVETSFEDSDTEKSAILEDLFDIPSLHDISYFIEDSKLLIVAYTQDPNHDGMKFFERSTKFYGISPIVIIGQKNESERDMFQSIYSKINHIYNQNQFKSKENLKVLILTEAHKSFFGSDPYTIIYDYSYLDAPTLFASKRISPIPQLDSFDRSNQESWKHPSPHLFLTDFSFLQSFLHNFFQSDPSISFLEYAFGNNSSQKDIKIDQQCKNL